MNMFEVVIANFLDREGFVAEVYFESIQWAEVFKEENRVLIRFFAHPHKKHWECPCEDSIKVIEQVKMKLLLRYGKGSFLEQETSSSVEQINLQTDLMLEEIINHPERRLVSECLERFGDVISIYDPQGRGVRYSDNGEFIGFLEQ